MKVFISHSGVSSRQIAQALNDWLPRIIQAVKPFFSSEIDKGAKWSNEIDKALEGTRFGIICLTPDNLKSEWIHYEAGALSKTKDASIWTFLLELKPSDVEQPLGKFQHTIAEKSDVLKLVKTINAKLGESGGEPLKERLLEEIFEDSWAKLEVHLNKAKGLIKIESKEKNVISTENIRSETDKLDEILEILRSLQRGSGSATGKLTVLSPFVGRFVLYLLTEKQLTTKDLENIENHISKLLDEPRVNIRRTNPNEYTVTVAYRRPLAFAEVEDIALNLSNKFPKFEFKVREARSLE